VDFGASLANQDISRKHELTVGTLGSKAL